MLFLEFELKILQEVAMIEVFRFNLSKLEISAIL